MKNKNIFICCTEQSGENICFNIVSRLYTKNFNIDGICGERSSKYFRNKFFDISNFKSIGLLEILISLPKYIKMINFLKTKIIQENYDLVICIDSPDFNYNLVKKLRKKNFSNTIIQIVAPSVWAWRPKRAKKFANLYDEIFLLFQFEKKYFQFKNISTTFIGHPVFHIKKRKDQKLYKYIAFLPGSRLNEINKLFRYFDKIESYINSSKLNFKIFIPTLPHLIDVIKIKTDSWNTETIITTDQDSFDNYFDHVLMSVTCSGTASLEIAKRNIPQIIIYKLNILTELIGKLFVRVKYASIINIMSTEMIIPELTNSNLSERKLLNSFKNLVYNKKNRIDQLDAVNKFIPFFETNISPYDKSVEKILKLI